MQLNAVLSALIEEQPVLTASEPGPAECDVPAVWLHAASNDCVAATADVELDAADSAASDGKDIMPLTPGACSPRPCFCYTSSNLCPAPHVRAYPPERA